MVSAQRLERMRVARVMAVRFKVPRLGPLVDDLLCRGAADHVERVAMAVAKGKRTPRDGRARGAKERVTRRRLRLRLLWAIGIVGIAVYLYYRPIASYVETKNDLATSRSEVESLRLVRAELELRLVNTTSVGSLEREARRINYVKPGERLFVVKGIPAWRQARNAGDRP